MSVEEGARLRAGEAPLTFNGAVERALALGDVPAALARLRTRPGELARRLDHLLRLASPEVAPAVLEAFAACAAAYWHGLAGDCLLRRRFPAALLLAGDLCQTLPEALREAQSLHQAQSLQTASVAADALHHPLQPEADARS